MFGDPEATAALRKTAADPAAEEASRRTALQTLVEAKAAGLPPLLRDLLADRTMRGPALRALAAFNDPETPALILKHYARLHRRREGRRRGDAGLAAGLRHWPCSTPCSAAKCRPATCPPSRPASC